VAANFANVALLSRVHCHVHAQLGIVHARLGTHLKTQICYLKQQLLLKNVNLLSSLFIAGCVHFSI
jgi:hypothetical protein